MSVPKLILLRLLQTVVSLSTLSRSVLPPNIRNIAQCQDQADANGADVNRMASDVQRRILAQVGEGRYKSATITDRNDESKTRGFDVVWRQVVAQPCQNERRAGEDAGCNEECAAVSDARCFGCELHDVADGSNEEADGDEWTAHLDAITDPRCQKDHEEGEEVRRYGEQLGCDALVTETRDDAWKEEREGVDRHQDEEEVDAHHNGVDVQNGHANLYGVSQSLRCFLAGGR